MISQLTGKIISSDEKSLIVDVNGVGYQVFCSLQTLLELKNSNEIITILTEFIVREDSQSLFGFSDPLEKKWFNLLISVQGVGAKAAIAILSSITIDELGYAISNSEKSTVVLAWIARTEIKFKKASPEFPEYCPGISKFPALNSVPKAAIPLLTSAAA